MRTDGTLVKIAQVLGIHSLNGFRAACEEGMETNCSGGLPDDREITAWIRGSTRPSRTDPSGERFAGGS